MSNDEELGLKKPKNIYEILRLLGIRYIGREAGRPNFPKESQKAKAFYWQTHQKVYRPFKEEYIDEAAAREITVDIVNKFGPLIWGTDRSNLFLAQEKVEYPRDLHWDKSEETRDFIKSQTFKLFEYRVSMGNKAGLAAGEKRKIEESNSEEPQKLRRTDSMETVALCDDGARTDASEYSPSTSNTPEPNVRRQSQPSNSPIQELIVKLRYRGCMRCNQEGLICDQREICTGCLHAIEQCSYPQSNTKFHSPSVNQVAPESLQLRNRTSAYGATEPLETVPGTKTAFQSTQFKNCVQPSGSAPRPDFPDIQTRLSETLVFLRFLDSEDEVSPMKLGLCSGLDSFFERVASHTRASVQSISKIAIRFPADIGRLENYVLPIKAGDELAFGLLVKTVTNGFTELGPTVPRRYILTATIVRG